MYKILRYICFLFFIILTVLYFFPQDSTPNINNFYQRITTFYQEIPEHFSQEGVVENTLQHDVDLLLFEPYNRVKNFFNNLSTDNALDVAIDRDFNDLEYLVAEYFLFNEFFEDIVLHYNDRIIYKHSQATSVDAIIITETRAVRRGDIRIEFVFNKNILQKPLDRIDAPIIVLYDSEPMYSKNQKISQDMLDAIENPNEKSRNAVHKTTLHQQLKTPIDVYLVVQKNSGIGRFLQILFWMIFPLMWILLCLLDRVIVRSISVNEENKQYKDFLGSMAKDAPEEEDSLEWLEAYVNEEELLKSDVENNDKQ